MVDPFRYFTFQLVLYDWSNKGYHVCGMFLIEKKIAHVVTATGFLSGNLRGLLPYIQHYITVKYNVLCASQNISYLFHINLK